MLLSPGSAMVSSELANQALNAGPALMRVALTCQSLYDFGSILGNEKAAARLSPPPSSAPIFEDIGPSPSEAVRSP